MFEDAGDYEIVHSRGDRSEAALYYAGLEPSMDYTDVEGPYRGEDPNQTLGELLNQDKKNRPNRSTFVSTDVKDAIMLMLPSLVRLFGASENPVNLVPRSPADSDMAEQATSYVNYVFWNDNPGFLNLYGAIKDALTVRTGFLKWWSEDEKEVKRKRFTNINLEQLQMLLAEDPTAKVVDLGKPIEQNAAPMPPPIGNPPPGLPLFRRLYRHPRAPVVHRLQWARLDRWLDRRREARRPGFSRQELREVLDPRMLAVLQAASRLDQWRAHPLHSFRQGRPHPRPSP